MLQYVLLVKTDFTKLKMGKYLANLAQLAIHAQRKTKSQFHVLLGL